MTQKIPLGWIVAGVPARALRKLSYCKNESTYTNNPIQPSKNMRSVNEQSAVSERIRSKAVTRSVGVLAYVTKFINWPIAVLRRCPSHATHTRVLNKRNSHTVVSSDRNAKLLWKLSRNAESFRTRCNLHCIVATRWSFSMWACYSEVPFFRLNSDLS